MRHIILFEPDSSGHRMVFVRYIAEAMARRGTMRATLITSEQARNAQWLQALDPDMRRHLSVVVRDDPRPSLLRLPRKITRQFGEIGALRDAITRLSAHDPVDHVLIPFADDYGLFPLAVQAAPFGTIPWSGIAIRPRFHLRDAGALVPPRPEDRIERWAYRRMLRSRTLDTLFSIDPYLAPALGDPRTVTVCDPADIASDTANRAWLGTTDDAVVLLVYGYIDHRKAIDRLLAITCDPRVPRTLVIALVGTQDPGIAPILAGVEAARLRADGRLIEVPRHVDDHEEASAFARADIVWGYYPGSYCSSGAMVRAGQTGRPLMATAEGLVGLTTRRHKSGLTAPEHDDEALLAALVRMTQDTALRRDAGEAGRRQFAASTGAAFGDRIITRLDAARTGRAQA